MTSLKQAVREGFSEGFTEKMTLKQRLKLGTKPYECLEKTVTVRANAL